MVVDALKLSAGAHVRQLRSGPLGGSATNNEAPGENTSAKTHTAAETSTETSTAGVPDEHRAPHVDHTEYYMRADHAGAKYSMRASHTGSKYSMCTDKAHTKN